MLEDERLADAQAVGIVKVERIYRYDTTNMMLFNNGYDVTVMITSATQLTMQQPVVSSLDPVHLDNLISTDIHYSIYPYFSSTLEVSM